MPTADHLVYIPGVLLLGIAVGYVLGARAVRSELMRQRRRSKE